MKFWLIVKPDLGVQQQQWVSHISYNLSWSIREVRGSNGPLKAVWVGGVQVNGLVPSETDKYQMDLARPR